MSVVRFVKLVCLEEFVAIGRGDGLLWNNVCVLAFVVVGRVTRKFRELSIDVKQSLPGFLDANIN